MIYFARKHDCEACALKPKCCPNIPARKIARSIHEAVSAVSAFETVGGFRVGRISGSS